MTIDADLLEILACPSDHKPLTLAPAEGEQAEELQCTECDRAYPIRDGIPVLLIDEARHREAS